VTSRGEATAAIFAVAVPLLGFWTVEISIASGPYPANCRMFGPVTNTGIVDFSGCLVYHFWMYLVIATSWGMAYLLVRSE
jgi:hypothetical protein